MWTNNSFKTIQIEQNVHHSRPALSEITRDDNGAYVKASAAWMKMAQSCKETPQK